jgi:hypothetical protein
MLTVNQDLALNLQCAFLSCHPLGDQSNCRVIMFSWSFRKYNLKNTSIGLYLSLNVKNEESQIKNCKYKTFSPRNLTASTTCNNVFIDDGCD